MLYADKENLKTRLAKDLLFVREKEMKFYARNLSMVGTHAALLAGFAFTILSQYEFKEPIEGYLPLQTEEWLGMWDNDRISFEYPHHSEAQVRDLKKGMGAWTWNTWLQQIFQVLHLLFTSLGMTLTLWTLYTCVITNILGIHLALRGPEGSVDKAVRHMAQQNQFALRKFMWGLVLFLLSVIFFSLSEYHFFVSLLIVISVLLMTRQIYKHIHVLVGYFHLKPETTITGQWDLTAKGDAAGGSGRAAAAAAGDSSNQKGPGVFGMGDMLARQSSFRSGGKRTAGEKKSMLSLRLDAFRERLQQGKRRGGSAWASLHGWAAGGSLIQDEATRVKEEQNPTFVAEQLIYRQQKTAPGERSAPPALHRRLTRSGSRAGRRMIRSSSAAFESSRMSSERLEAGSMCSGGSPGRRSLCSTRWSSETTRERAAELGSRQGVAEGEPGSRPGVAREESNGGLLPNVLGLSPFVDDLVSKFGSRGCADQEHAWNLASSRTRRATSTTTDVDALEDGVGTGSLAEQSRGTDGSVDSCRDEGAGSGSSRPLDRRTSTLDGNFLDQAGEVLTQVKGHAEEALEKMLDRMGLQGVPCDPRGPTLRSRSGLVTFDSPGVASSSARGSPCEPSFSPPSPRPSPQAVAAAAQWAGLSQPEPHPGPPSREHSSHLHRDVSREVSFDSQALSPPPGDRSAARVSFEQYQGFSPNPRGAAGRS